jgi:hypothetical protein
MHQRPGLLAPTLISDRRPLYYTEATLAAMTRYSCNLQVVGRLTQEDPESAMTPQQDESLQRLNIGPSFI